MNNISDYIESPGAFIKNGQTKKYKWVLKADTDLAYTSPDWHFDLKLTKWVATINVKSHIVEKQKKGAKRILLSLGVHRVGDTWFTGGPQDERLTINDDILSPHSYKLAGEPVIELLTPEQVSKLVNNLYDESINLFSVLEQ